jgi:hypothetical protein
MMEETTAPDGTVVHCCGIETMSGDAVGYMQTLVDSHKGVDVCSRCGAKHAALEWVALANPVSSAPEGVTPSAVIGFAMCPTNSQPIFLTAWDMGDEEGDDES